MILVQLGRAYELPGNRQYTHTADVRMWVGNEHYTIGSLKQRYSDSKLDFVPSGTLLEEERESALGFDTAIAAVNWLDRRLNSRELIATARSRG